MPPAVPHTVHNTPPKRARANSGTGTKQPLNSFNNSPKSSKHFTESSKHFTVTGQLWVPEPTEPTPAFDMTTPLELTAGAIDSSRTHFRPSDPDRKYEYEGFTDPLYPAYPPPLPGVDLEEVIMNEKYPLKQMWDEFWDQTMHDQVQLCMDKPNLLAFYESKGIPYYKIIRDPETGELSDRVYKHIMPYPPDWPIGDSSTDPYITIEAFRDFVGPEEQQFISRFGEDQPQPTDQANKGTPFVDKYGHPRTENPQALNDLDDSAFEPEERSPEISSTWKPPKYLTPPKLSALNTTGEAAWGQLITAQRNFLNALEKHGDKATDDDILMTDPSLYQDVPRPSIPFPPMKPASQQPHPSDISLNPFLAGPPTQAVRPMARGQREETRNEFAYSDYVADPTDPMKLSQQPQSNKQGRSSFPTPVFPPPPQTSHISVSPFLARFQKEETRNQFAQFPSSDYVADPTDADIARLMAEYNVDAERAQSMYWEKVIERASQKGKQQETPSSTTPVTYGGAVRRWGTPEKQKRTHAEMEGTYSAANQPRERARSPEISGHPKRFELSPLQVSPLRPRQDTPPEKRQFITPPYVESAGLQDSPPGLRYFQDPPRQPQEQQSPNMDQLLREAFPRTYDQIDPMVGMYAASGSTSTSGSRPIPPSPTASNPWKCDGRKSPIRFKRFLEDERARDEARRAATADKKRKTTLAEALYGHGGQSQGQSRENDESEDEGLGDDSRV